MNPDEARAAMCAAFVVRPRVESVELSACHGRVLAQDVAASRDQPPFSASAMDGYALRAADTPGRLRVVGESAAGRAYGKPLQPGEAVRIFTGAPVPDDADAVLIQENAKREGADLISPPVPAGDNVRRRGVDFESGAALLRKGARLDGVALALAAATGAAHLDVHARPRIAILATGDEIVTPGSMPRGDQIFESGSFGIAALVQDWGGISSRLKVEIDDVAALSRTFEAALEHADLLVTIGGASVGDHDLVRPALDPFAPRFAVERIGLRPGKPTFFAHTDRGAVLGLPGNPASALVCSHLFLRSLIEHWFSRDPAPRFAQAKLAAPLPKNGPREHYLRARLSKEGTQLRVHAAEDQDSSLLSVFQNADALIRRPPNAAPAAADESVDVLELGRVF